MDNYTYDELLQFWAGDQVSMSDSPINQNFVNFDTTTENSPPTPYQSHLGFNLNSQNPQMSNLLQQQIPSLSYSQENPIIPQLPPSINANYTSMDNDGNWLLPTEINERFREDECFDKSPINLNFDTTTENSPPAPDQSHLGFNFNSQHSQMSNLSQTITPQSPPSNYANAELAQQNVFTKNVDKGATCKGNKRPNNEVVPKAQNPMSIMNLGEHTLTDSPPLKVNSAEKKRSASLDRRLDEAPKWDDIPDEFTLKTLDKMTKEVSKLKRNKQYELALADVTDISSVYLQSKSSLVAHNGCLDIKLEASRILFKTALDAVVKQKLGPTDTEEEYRILVVLKERIYASKPFTLFAKYEKKAQKESKRRKTSERYSKKELLELLNNGEKKELLNLNGIGNKYAEAIIKWRENHKFENLSVLRDVCNKIDLADFIKSNILVD